MEKTKKVEIEDACPFPPNTPSRVFVSTSSKIRGPALTFKRVYLMVSLFLIILIPTVLVLTGDVGVRSILLGEVLSVEYKSEPYPHTGVSYAAKPLKDEMGILPDAEVKSLELNGDLRNIFQTGSYYNVTYEKKALALYPDLINVRVQLPVTKQLIVTSVGPEIVGGEGTTKFYTHVTMFWRETLRLKGSYGNLFENGGYYNITYVGGTLLRCQKLENPYAFWVATCLLTDSISFIDLVKMIPGNETIVGLDVDGVACTEFTQFTPTEGVWYEFTFMINQPVNLGSMHTVTLWIVGGADRSFVVKGGYGSGDIFT
jgi:hypothetical protein